MSEIKINYPSLESAINNAVKARGKIDEYIAQIGNTINCKISSLEGTDTCGYAQSAASLATDKVTQLNDKKTYFSNLEKTIQNVMDVARNVDAKVAVRISTLAEKGIEKRTWFESAGDVVYNTFCVDLVNHFSFIRTVVDIQKCLNDKIGNGIEAIHNWFKYGNGKYVWNIATSVVGVVASLIGAVVAIVTAPFDAGMSIPVAIACIGSLATCVGSLAAAIDNGYKAYGNMKAMSLSLDGKTGAARYYGSITKWSDAVEKTDFGGEYENEEVKEDAKEFDTMKTVADVLSVTCNIASLGNVKNFKTGEINFEYNAGKFSKGYGFNAENIKRNLLNEMGVDIETGKFKEGAFTFGLKSNNNSPKDFEFLENDVIIHLPDKCADFFNKVETTNNTLTFLGNVDGVYDFYTNPDKKPKDFLAAVENITGIGSRVKAFSVIDKYGTETEKTIRGAFGY